MNPDGIFLSNGPGDPEPCDYAIDAIKAFLATNTPVFGICLATSCWVWPRAKTVKMKFGHHGANHPVKSLDDNTVMITAQNHGFAVDEAQPAGLPARDHVSLFDGSWGHPSHRPSGLQLPGASGGEPGPARLCRSVRPLY